MSTNAGWGKTQELREVGVSVPHDKHRGAVITEANAFQEGASSVCDSKKKV